MSATQSHAFAFRDFPATRTAWPGSLAQAIPAAAQLGGYLFTAVIVGVVEQALNFARAKLAAMPGEISTQHALLKMGVRQ